MVNGHKKAIMTALVLLLCLALTSAFLLGAVNSTKHMLHHCTGKNCRLCDLLANRAYALKQLAQALLIAGVTAVAYGLLPLFEHSFSALGGQSAILVCLKIRMNN